MNRKILCLLIALLTVSSLTSCQSGSDGTSSPQSVADVSSESEKTPLDIANLMDENLEKLSYRDLEYHTEINSNFHDNTLSSSGEETTSMSSLVDMRFKSAGTGNDSVISISETSTDQSGTTATAYYFSKGTAYYSVDSLKCQAPSSYDDFMKFSMESFNDDSYSLEDFETSAKEEKDGGWLVSFETTGGKVKNSIASMLELNIEDSSLFSCKFTAQCNKDFIMTSCENRCSFSVDINGITCDFLLNQTCTANNVGSEVTVNLPNDTSTYKKIDNLNVIRFADNAFSKLTQNGSFSANTKTSIASSVGNEKYKLSQTVSAKGTAANTKLDFDLETKRNVTGEGTDSDIEYIESYKDGIYSITYDGKTETDKTLTYADISSYLINGLFPFAVDEYAGLYDWSVTQTGDDGSITIEYKPDESYSLDAMQYFYDFMYGASDGVLYDNNGFTVNESVGTIKFDSTGNILSQTFSLDTECTVSGIKVCIVVSYETASLTLS